MLDTNHVNGTVTNNTKSMIYICFDVNYCIAAFQTYITQALLHPPPPKKVK